MNPNEFENLLQSVREAGQIKRGELKDYRSFTFDPANIKDIRRKLGVSQTDFAMMIGVSVATLRNWEQGRRTPRGPARALLKVAAESPEVVAKALVA